MTFQSYEETVLNASEAAGKLKLAIWKAVAGYIPESRGSRMSFEDFLMEVEAARPYFHAHQCEKCNTVWAHHDHMAGSEEAHMCPSCKHGPFWERYSERSSSFNPPRRDRTMLFDF